MTVPNILPIDATSPEDDHHDKPTGAVRSLQLTATIHHNPNLMCPAAAAAYLGIKESTLAVWRCTKRYPLSFVKVGRLVYYNKTALDAFLESRTVLA